MLAVFVTGVSVGIGLYSYEVVVVVEEEEEEENFVDDATRKDGQLNDG
jgi:hypothetical protein